MEWQGWFSLILMAGALTVLIFTRIGTHLVMLSVVAVLGSLGILDYREALEGFGNPGLITVAAMFVIAAGLQGAGSVDMLSGRLLGQPKSVRSALARIFAPVLLLSAFLNNTPVVATMIPAIHTWCRRIRIAPSKLMIPLSYTAILGGTLTMIGTSTNLVVNSQYQALTGEPGFSLFAITPLGLPVALVGLLFMWLCFPKWLPDRSDKQAFANLREFTLEVCVASDGPLVGKTVMEAGLRDLERLYLAEIERQGSIITAVPSEEKLHAGDRLTFAGDTQAISDLLRINGIVPSSDSSCSLDRSEGGGQGHHAERCLVEAVVSPHCAAVGLAIRDARFRARYGAVVLAVARSGERVRGNLSSIVLETGDTLLLEARPAFVSRQRYSKDFLLISDFDIEAPRRGRAYLAWGILLAVVALAAFNLLSMLNAALLGALAMIFSGCCSVSQAEKSLDLTVLLTIAASFALGAALQKTGVAGFLAPRILALSGGSPLLLLCLTYLAVSLLTAVITNNAAAVLLLPIVLEIVTEAGLPAKPFVFAIMMGASAGFATPLGYQTNLMVYGPGGYRFSDFLKVGLPMNLLLGIVTLGALLLFQVL
ncbi:SLC13 family permease [Candidatus Haliotispira prima]|uniref:SLC13 family permease n=1 Tax=Candidatus Haliotispira prima TaxID=3034016 RepID=A0ABY8MEV5_9SPIO|nr:SLC13 family permease [Candidatus Haliotispira prima]